MGFSLNNFMESEGECGIFPSHFNLEIFVNVERRFQ